MEVDTDSGLTFDVSGEVLDLAISYYGKPNQVLKLIEELQELSFELLTTIRCGNVSDTNALYYMTRRILTNLIEMRNVKPKQVEISGETVFRISDEMADCLIMIEQGIRIFENRKLTHERIRAKEYRLIERLEADE